MDWLSGSGGTGETPSQSSRHFWQTAPVSERQSLSRVEAYAEKIGRMLYILPVFRALIQTDWSRGHARPLFERVKSRHHQITANGIERMLARGEVVDFCHGFSQIRPTLFEGVGLIILLRYFLSSRRSHLFPYKSSKMACVADSGRAWTLFESRKKLKARQCLCEACRRIPILDTAVYR